MIFFAKHTNEEARGLNRAMSEFDLRKLNWASTGLAGTAENQIHPYRRDSKYQPQYDLCILRTNRQIQDEAEKVFYGWSSFNLTVDAFAPGEVQTFQFFQSLPPKYRKLISRVEIRCFCGAAGTGNRRGMNNHRVMSLFDWNAFMKFLALECSSLRSLILWAFADGHEGDELKRNCRMSTDWVQSILQIKTLRFFDIRAIPRRAIAEGQSCVPEVVRDLRSVLYQQSNALTTAQAEFPSSFPGSTFPFAQLPGHLRNRIYRFALLPADKHLHPYLKSWYDGTTRNAVPLFLTCRQIQKEAEAILYGEGIFCAPAHKYDQPLSTFLENLPIRLARQINHTVTSRRLLSDFFDEESMNKSVIRFRFPRDAQNTSCPLPQYPFRVLQGSSRCALDKIIVETDDLDCLDQQMRDWITQGFIDLGSFRPGLILTLEWVHPRFRIQGI